MRKLRYAGLVVGAMLLLLMLRCIRAGAAGEYIALAPAAITGAALLIANIQEPYSRERRRLVAYAWIAAAGGAALSSVLSLALQVPAVGTLCLVLTVGEAVGASYAWRRSKFFRLKYYNNYLED